MKVMLVFGTRPEAIKMAPLVKALQQDNFFNVKLAVTGQHREMLDQVLSLFELEPDFDLNVMAKDQDLYDVTTKVMLGLRDVFENEKPDLVLVHGDTATTFAAALSAFYKQIRIAHVEAGLRTHNLKSPWPEEANRQLTGRIADIHFAPTERNASDLRAEGVAGNRIAVTGNTVIDALRWVIGKISSSAELLNSTNAQIKNSGLNLDVLSNRYVLITGHRRENFGLGFENVCNALGQLAGRHPDTHFIYPVHLNPNVQEPVNRFLGDFENIHLIRPLGYAPFVHLMSNCYLVLTDSGGVQEEAPGLGKPVLVMRDTTERPEAVEAGTVKLVGTNSALIVKELSALLEDHDLYTQMSKAHNPFGDGFACQRIIEYLKQSY
ncbi:non-hydrolyzing UDP-N-acetylglucosamine 2-epimerase [Pseudidiomarina gelatinasegens]|uniref:non-hydrolyzing UDP-N-acetylglucosamine 2-epimerase n=1 Tax=Pseudidiomarina gelatinasegens TaxID=2487740 RepID=UPI0030ED4EBD|tara:strand:- start:3022 stop:4158 length:1137 start_codon:yes stop_codon:yes gene_type:complete